MSLELPSGSVALVRRAVDANLRYYEALGELTLDYVRTLRSLTTAHAGLAPQAAATEATAEPAPTLVLEAESGATALGAFMVQNLLDAPVSAPVSVSPLVSPEGDRADLELRLDPEVVSLAPGEQALVRLAVVLRDSLAPGVGYRGEASVPGLTGTRVPLLVRRREVAV